MLTETIVVAIATLSGLNLILERIVNNPLSGLRASIWVWRDSEGHIHGTD